MTGDAGFIGTHLRRALDDAGHDVSGIDIVQHRVGAGTTLKRGCDLLDRSDAQTSLDLDWTLTTIEPDVVVHLAAQVGRLFGEDDLEHTITSNALMTSLVARSCAAAACRPRLVYCSTSEVYGDLGPLTGSEEGGLRELPHNLYGLSKRWGEEAAAMYALAGAVEPYGAPLRGGLQVIRPSMPYGPGLPPGRGRAAIVNMIWQAANNEPIPVHRGAERSWCWVGDAVRGIRLVIEAGEVAYRPASYEAGYGCYNVGRDDAAVSMRHVAEVACALAGASPDLIEEVDAPARQTVVKRLATEKLRELGWEPAVGLVEGMTRTRDAMVSLGQLVG